MSGRSVQSRPQDGRADEGRRRVYRQRAVPNPRCRAGAPLNLDDMLARLDRALHEGEGAHAIEFDRAGLEDDIGRLCHLAVDQRPEPNAAARLIHLGADGDLEIVALGGRDAAAQAGHRVPHIKSGGAWSRLGRRDCTQASRTECASRGFRAGRSRSRTWLCATCRLRSARWFGSRFWFRLGFGFPDGHGQRLGRRARIGPAPSPYAQ